MEQLWHAQLSHVHTTWNFTYWLRSLEGAELLCYAIDLPYSQHYRKQQVSKLEAHTGAPPCDAADTLSHRQTF